MRMKLTAILLALLVAFSAFGEPGEAVYLMVLSDRAAAPDVVSLGGRILQWWSDRRLIAIPYESVEKLRGHDGVAYLQRVWTDVEDRQSCLSPGRQDCLPSTQALAGMVPNAVPPPWTTGTFSYDPSGNIKKVGDDSFGYDRVGRITTATVKDQTQLFSYDAYGNLNQLGPQTLNVDTATNRLLTEHIASQTQRSFDYDAIGNVTRDADNRKYHYDALGMVTAIDLAPTDWGDGDMRMIYTAGDERIIVAGLTTTRYRVRDLGARVLREWKSTNNFPEWERDYIYAGGVLVAGEVQIDQRQNGQRHYHTDHLGSTRLVTDGAGALVSRHDYLAFGAEVLPTNTEFTNTKRGPRDPKKFTGHERDYFSMADGDGDAVDYMHARYYAPEWGRFLTIDPVLEDEKASRQPQRWNRYSYVMNNPVRYTDPTGKVVTDADDVRKQVEQRKLAAQQEKLANYAKVLAQHVKAGNLDSKLAINLYWNKATALTKTSAPANSKGAREAKESALLIATGAALAVRGEVSNNITRPSMGIDTLHHFFINAVNTHDGIPVGIQKYMANDWRNETDQRDIAANNAGAEFGSALMFKPNIQPSSFLP